MRAVVIRQFQTTPAVEQLPDPPCPPDGVVLRVDATGVCRSDWHAWSGHDGDVHLPIVPGHELAGTVLETGPQVRRWRPGALVTVPFVCACGVCATCQAGEQQVCPDQQQPGFTYDGSFAELVAVPHADTNLVAVPEGVSAVTAASLGCRFATAYRALHAHGRVRAGDEVAVIGCGGVGLSAVMIAVAAGAHVVAVDPSIAALEAAAELGATILDPADAPPHEVAELVRDATGGGAHIGLDALGSVATATTSMLSLRRRGRHVQVGLLLGEHAAPVLPMGRVIAWELELYGSHGMAAHEYPAMLADVAAGRLDPARLVRRTVGLDEAPAALLALGGAPVGAGMTVVVP